jgi:hypothetical protein
MNQVATKNEAERAIQPAPTQTDGMISMLERVLMDPNVPVERLERLLELQDRERQRQAKVVWAERMSETQAEIHAVVKNQDNSQTRSRYATYDALDRMVRPLYTRHGFSVTFNTETVSESTIRVVAFVENSGFERRYEIEMPCDGKGAKGGDVMTKTHAVKSAVTYGKATLLPMIFNIAVTDKADDGNGACDAVEPQLITSTQVTQLRQEMAAHDVDEVKFREWCALDRLEDMSPTLFERALRNIRLKKRDRVNG